MLDTLGPVVIGVVLLGLVAPLVLLGILLRFRARAVAPGTGPRFAFVIRPRPGEWLRLQQSQFESALRTRSVPSNPVAGWGDHRIRARDVEIAFACENDTVEVSFEGEIERDDAELLVKEIRDSIASSTGQVVDVEVA